MVEFKVIHQVAVLSRGLTPLNLKHGLKQSLSYKDIDVKKIRLHHFGLSSERENDVLFLKTTSHCVKFPTYVKVQRVIYWTSVYPSPTPNANFQDLGFFFFFNIFILKESIYLCIQGFKPSSFVDIKQIILRLSFLTSLKANTMSFISESPTSSTLLATQNFVVSYLILT